MASRKSRTNFRSSAATSRSIRASSATPVQEQTPRPDAPPMSPMATIPPKTPLIRRPDRLRARVPSMPDDARKQPNHPSDVAPRQRALASVLLLMLAFPLNAADQPKPQPATTRATTRPFPFSPAARAVQQFHDLLKSNRQPEAAQLL